MVMVSSGVRRENRHTNNQLITSTSSTPTRTIDHHKPSPVSRLPGRAAVVALLKDICSVTFSRSSGPGGQNVNKVNTKAMLRMPVGKAHFLPSHVREELSGSPYYTKSKDILVHSDSSRRQHENLEECYQKVYSLLRKLDEVPGTTTPEQKERVQWLMKMNDLKRKDVKRHQSAKKASRRSVRKDF